MAYIARTPGLGMQQDRATVVAWHASPGDRVETGELLVEIETEKTTFEVEAAEDGVLERVYAAEGDVTKPNEPLGIVAGPDEDVSSLESDVDESAIERDDAGGSGEPEEPAVRGNGARAENDDDAGPADRKISPRARRRAEELGVDLATVEGSGPEGAVTSDDVEAAADGSSAATPDGDDASEPERVTPRARRRAEELGVDLATVEGSGPGGAVTEADVEAGSDAGATRTVRDERPFSEIRRTIARRLQESDREAVHVTVDRTADAEALLAAADAAANALETDVSSFDVLLVALSATLEEHPTFNATLEDETLSLYEEHNVGIAVDFDRGLVTPVLEDVGSRSLREIATERRDLTDRTLAGEFTATDLEGGTFTVSNLGPLGIESFDPIIDPPQVAILGVNAIEERATPGPDDGAVTFRRHLPLSLSFDHRAVDGADAARFLETLVDYLETPWSLLPATVEAQTGAAGATGVTGDDASGQAVDLPGRSLTARTEGGLSGTVTGGSFAWSFDEPEDGGGSGAAPTPVDRFLGSLAACLSASIGFQADKRDVDLSSVDVSVDGHPDHGSLESISLSITISAAADDEALERLVELGERGCHVASALRDDLPLEVTWERA